MRLLLRVNTQALFCSLCKRKGAARPKRRQGFPVILVLDRKPVFYFLAIVTNVETVAELAILAMSMFLAAFFCLKVLFIPDSAMKTIDKIYEVEEEIYQER